MLGITSRRLAAFLLGAGFCGVTVASACAEKKGALMLAINTDMKAPKDVNAVSVTISTNGAIKHSFIGRVTPQGEVLLPATLAIVEPDDSGASIRVRVMAFQDRQPRVLRDVRTTVPTGGRTALLRIPLNFVSDKSAVGASLPEGLVPDPLPGTGGIGGSSGSSGSSGGSGGAGEFDFFGSYQPPCPDIQNQTIIDGECKDNYVDPDTLPDFDADLIGDGTNPGTCFDLARCFANASAIGLSQGDTRPPVREDAGGGAKEMNLGLRAVSVDLASCSIALNGADAARLNLAIQTPDTGECVRPGDCYIPIDRGPSGWQDANGRVQLPAYVCKLVGGKSLRLVAAENTCAAKEEKSAVCSSKPGAIVDGGPIGSPALVAESFATSLTVLEEQLYFAGSTRIGAFSLADPNPRPNPVAFPIPPSKAAWRFGGSLGPSVVNGSATGYVLRREGSQATSVAVAPGTVDVANAPNGDLGWAVSGAGDLGGIYTSKLTGAATRVALPITQATALVALSTGGVLTGAVIGDGAGNVRTCDFGARTCNQPTRIPSGVRVDVLTGEGQTAFALTADGIYRINLVPNGGEGGIDLAPPVLVRGAKTAPILEGGVEYRRQIALGQKCLFFSSADGLEWVNRDEPSQRGIVATATGPVLGVTLATRLGARPDASTMAVYYTVFADAATGGGVYSAPMPPQCASQVVEPPDGGSVTCPSTMPISTAAYPWKSPATGLQGVCSTADLNTVVTHFDTNPNSSYTAARASIADPTCGACIFGNEAEADWAPILTANGASISRIDVGACIAIASSNDNCGRAYQAWHECTLEACKDCASQAALDSCRPKASSGACKAAFTAIDTTCGAGVAASAEAACAGAKYNFEGSIKATCIGLL